MMNFQARFEKSFALLLSEQLSDLAGVLFDELGRVQQCISTIFRRDVRPYFESFLSRLNRLLHVFVVALRDGVYAGSRCRVAHFGRVLGDGVDGFAADKHLGH